MNRRTINTVSGESKQLLAEEVFQYLATRIVDGEFGPGHRIRDIEVADDLHVSRTPVREALQRLERLGLVTMFPSRYTEVTAVTPEILAQTLEFAGFQAGIAARLGVQRMSDDEREHVAALVDEMIDADTGPEISASRWAVFSFLSDHSGNAQHRAVTHETGTALFRNLREWEVPEADRERMQQVYRDFREAVLHGDGDTAEQLARTMHYV